MSILDSGIEHADQQPAWPDPALADEVRAELRRRPALVTGQEVADLAEALAAAQGGRASVLHAGDCAELFAAASARSTRRKVAQLGVLADTISRAAGLPVVRVGRIVGQFVRPRSSPVDRLAPGLSVPSYRGDAVNDIAATPAARTPDPRRLLAAYDTARATLDVIRDACPHLPEAERLYTAHEFLLLDYEVPLVRGGLGGSYATSAHTGWVGYRTRSPGGRHVALAASITNPVAVKVGPSTSPEDAVAVSHVLNPEGRPGRLTFVVRLSSEVADDLLPPLVAAVGRPGAPVGWLCDPLHGNTILTSRGRKTRRLPAIGREAWSFTRVVLAHGQWPGGLHLETTPEDVTECVSPERDEAVAAALPRYRSACDPRLNPDQAAAVVDVFITALQQFTD